MKKPKSWTEFIEQQKALRDERAVMSVAHATSSVFDSGRAMGAYEAATRILEEMEVLIKTPNDEDIDE